MVDEDRVRNMNEVAQEFGDSLAQAYRTVYGQTSEAGEQQAQLARTFFDQVRNRLREQTERGRAVSDQLSAQQREQQETARAFAQESVDAYMNFFDDASSYFRTSAEQAVGSSQEGLRTVSDTTTSLLGTATGAAQAVTGAGRFPIAGYDQMNVEEASKHLDDLSVDELRAVRDYEERNKKRETLLEQMDRKIRAA